MSPFTGNGDDKKNLTNSIDTYLKNIIAIIIIIFTIVIIMYHLPVVRSLKLNFPPVF